MLTQQPSATAADAAPTAAEAAPAQTRSIDDLIAYFEGEYVPLRDAKVSIMTHAFMYGTATFEGIRGYWNAEQETLYVLFVREHLERLNTRDLELQERQAYERLPDDPQEFAVWDKVAGWPRE